MTHLNRVAATLVRELQNFQVKITAAANETFGVWRDGQHDDLVLAVALASWWGERNPPHRTKPGKESRPTPSSFTLPPIRSFCYEYD
jgi:hypothetical protein